MARREKARRTRLEVDERRAQLLKLGLEFFGSRPYDEVSIDEVARAAEISKGLLYHYFPTKRDFYVATLREGAQELLDRTQPPAELEPIARLYSGLDAYLSYVQAHAAAYTALMRGGIGSDPEVAGVLEHARATILGRILAGMEPLQPPPLARLALRGWIGSVEVMSLEWVERREVTQTELRDLAASMFLGLLQLTLGLAPAP